MTPAARERIYIVPRLSGLLLAFCVLLIVGLGYVFDGVELETRVLGMAVFAVGLAALFRTNENLRGVRATAAPPPTPLLAGDPVRLEAAVLNHSGEQRIGLRLRALGTRGSRGAFFPRLPAGGRMSATLVLPPMPRGVHRLPALRVSTVRPAGLLYSWKVFQPHGELVIAPRPCGQPLDGRPAKPMEEGDPSEVRLRRAEDPPSRTDWKILARTGRWMVRESPDTQPAEPLIFRWEDVEGLRDTEERLGQLMLWVLEASRLGRPFCLELQGSQAFSLPAACRLLASFPR